MAYDVTEVISRTDETADGVSAPYEVSSDDITFVLHVGALSGATVNATIEWSLDGVVWGGADPFTEFTEPGNEFVVLAAKAPLARVVYDLGASTTATFSVKAYGH